MADHAHGAACLAASMVVWKSSANPTARLLPSDVPIPTGVGLTRLEALYPFRFVGTKGNLGGNLGGSTDERAGQRRILDFARLSSEELCLRCSGLPGLGRGRRLFRAGALWGFVSLVCIGLGWCGCWC